MCNMYSNNSEKNSFKTILFVCNDYLLKAKLEYFNTNNVSSNDTFIIEIIDLICLNLNFKEKKLQCIGHIINLIVKTFIFGNKSKYFKTDIVIAKSTNDIKIVIKLWKK